MLGRTTDKQLAYPTTSAEDGKLRQAAARARLGLFGLDSALAEAWPWPWAQALAEPRRAA
eukprot:7209192-Pyramimonas_sp.AAC.1